MNSQDKEAAVAADPLWKKQGKLKLKKMSAEKLAIA